MERNPAALARLMSAYVELVDRFKNDPKAWTSLYAARSGVDPELAAESLQGATLHYTFSEAQMIRMAKFLAETGVTTRDVSAELPKNIDYQPLMRATGKTEAELGGDAK